jgi:hypothetical protein
VYGLLTVLNYFACPVLTQSRMPTASDSRNADKGIAHPAGRLFFVHIRHTVRTMSTSEASTSLIPAILWKVIVGLVLDSARLRTAASSRPRCCD